MQNTTQALALLGGGIWGRKILRDLVALGAAVTVFEPLAGRHAELAELGAVAVRADFPAPGDDFAGFVVATPSTTHRAVLERLLPLDRPIFLEKPLTTTLADAEALARLDVSRVFLMHVWRYHPGIMALAEVARTRVLGELKGIRSVRANWTSPRGDTDALWNLAVHDLTIARAILGYLPEPRAALAERHGGVIRSFQAFLGEEPYLSLEVSNRYERKVREVRLHCTGGVAVLPSVDADHVLLVYGDDRSDPGEVRREKRVFGGESALVAELREFLGYLGGGAAPRCGFGEGLEVIRMLDALERMSA